MRAKSSSGLAIEGKHRLEIYRLAILSSHVQGRWNNSLKNRLYGENWGPKPRETNSDQQRRTNLGSRAAEPERWTKIFLLTHRNAERESG